MLVPLGVVSRDSKTEVSISTSLLCHAFSLRGYKCMSAPRTQYQDGKVSFTAKGRRYVTIVLNLESGAVVRVCDGKGADALGSFWKRLRGSKSKIQAVAMEMSPAYHEDEAACLWIPGPRVFQTQNHGAYMRLRFGRMNHNSGTHGIVRPGRRSLADDNT